MEDLQFDYSEVILISTCEKKLSKAFLIIKNDILKLIKLLPSSALAGPVSKEHQENFPWNFTNTEHHTVSAETDTEKMCCMK